MKRYLLIAFGAVAVLFLFFRIFFGIFVIQPIGAVPDGATIVYWRAGMDMSFVSSADGMLDRSGAGVSLLGRAMALGKLSDPIREREIFRAGYSETLYLWSTGGKEYSR